MRIRVLSLALATTIATLAALPLAASAAPLPLEFGVKANDAPKGYFVFNSKPGERVRGSFVLSNLTGRRQVVYLREADAFTAQAGGVEFTKQGGVPIHAGTWFEIARHTVILRPHEDVEVGITGQVPLDARAGDHLAGIIVYGKRPPRAAANANFGFRLLSRLAIAVQFTLPGDRVTSLDVKGTDIFVSPVGAVLQLDLGNNGNALIKKTTGTLHVTKGSRRLFSPKVRLGTFVPKTEIRYPLSWPGTPVEGTYHVSGVLHPQGGRAVRIDTDVKFGKARIRQFREQTGRQAIESSGTPGWIWALLGAALTAVIALLLLLLRSRPRGEGDPAATRPRDYPPSIEYAHAELTPAPDASRVPVAVAHGNGVVRTLDEASGLVDLNSAGVDELSTLPGVGRLAAERIVAHRDEYGRFATVMDLREVDGFDEKRIRRLEEHVSV
jgi:competence ComEA-like helix-hairpin-helix protein